MTKIGRWSFPSTAFATLITFGDLLRSTLTFLKVKVGGPRTKRSVVEGGPIMDFSAIVGGPRTKRSVVEGWLLLAILFSFSLSSCENDLSKVEKIASNEISLPVETSKMVELMYSDSSIVKAKLKTPILKFYKVANPYHEMSRGLYVEFYNANGEVESTLSAKHGRKFQNQGIIEVKDSVVVINNKGERLDTERLVWNEKTKKIYTNSFVRITTQKDIMFGEGMEANQNFTNYRIYKYRGSVSLDETEQ